ncbi:MAG TPA: alpha-L-arabinofuranosidase C-terminal domain-containing protein, partial [Acidimicrobiales bacterium]|nr:alpha-L-arabinofuranosidase C-terminal domain-containing protein [Acidimicrobiales bacterium]
EYVAEATRWARAIKMVDPTARLVSCGELGWTDWDRVVIDGLAPLVDLHSVHIYTGSDDYWTNVLSPHAAQRAIDVTAAALSRAAYAHGLARPPRIVYDEWNVWFRDRSGALEERYVWSDALAVGAYLNIFVRNCRWVAMANLAQMVNVIAPIVTTPATAVTQPIYYPFLLHSHGHLDEAVDAFVDGPTVGPPAAGLSSWAHRVDDQAPFGLVDAAATVDTGRSRVAVTLVNRSESPERVELVLRDREFDGVAQLRVVTAGGPSPAVTGVETVELDEVQEHPNGGVLVAELPARSFTLLEAPVLGGGAASG